MRLLPIRICKKIIYECGCLCEYELLNLSATKKWRVVPCCEEHSRMARLETQAEQDWQDVLRALLTEHNCIQFLTEKGYRCTT